MEERTEAELVTLAQAGDTDAFAQLVERVQVMASALAFRLIANPEMVREVVQEATLQAFLSLGRLRDPTRFKPWFYGIVLNLCRTWLREQKTRVFSLDAYTAERQATFPRFLETPDPYEIIEEQELQQLIQEAVQRLAPHTRSVIWLFYYQELHMQDIATRLGISLAAVKNRLYKGRSELRRHLLGAYPEMERRHQVASGKRRRKMMIAVKLIHVVRQPLQHAAVLLDERGQRVLPIWMNGKEGYLVSATFSSHWDMSVVDASGQPRMNFSNQFLWELLEAVRDSVEEVRVDTLQEELLYGTVRLHLNATSHEIKTTIGMALVVAIRMQCPILVPEALLNARGLSLPAEGATLEQQLTHLVQMLGKHLPTFPVTTQVAGQAKQPHNLDFSEGTQGWQHGEFIPSHSVSEGTQFLQFACAIDPGTTYQGHPSLSIQQTVERMQAEGDLRQTFLADDYRGKRVQLSAFLKTREIGAAELWVQVEGLNELLGEGGMQGGPLQGTHEWTRCTLEVEVPPESIAMELSLRVHGPGQVWLALLRLEVVHEHVSFPAS